MRDSTTHQTAARAARLAEIRLRVAAGAYETPDKLERALDAFLERQMGRNPVDDVTGPPSPFIDR